MKTLVIGSTGFIGSYYKKFSKSNNLFYTSSKKRKNYIKFDLIKDDIKKIISDKKIKKVIFLSAISNPEECENNKKKSNLINVIKTKEVMKYLIEKKIYFIFFSSEYVFDGKRGNYTESSHTKSKILYGRQKILIEKFLKKKNGNFSIFRIGKTYGNLIDDKSIFSNFVKELISGKKKFKVAFDQKFSALHVLDLVNIIDFFIKKEFTGIFNVCGNECFTRYQYFERIINYLKLKDVVLQKEKFKKLTKVKEIPLNVCMYNKKIRNKINFKLKNFIFYLKFIKYNYAKKIKK